jgi:hypothetical protein
MNDHEEQSAVSASPPAQPVAQHAEPQQGGSFTRDLDTGALVRNKRIPADQPEQE